MRKSKKLRLYSPRKADTKVKTRLFKGTQGVPIGSKPRGRSSIQSITNACMRGQYYTALRHILSKSNKARQAFHTIVRKQVSLEVVKLTKICEVYPKFEGRESLAKFKWQDIITLMENDCPTLYAALHGCMPKNQKTEHLQFRSNTVVLSLFGHVFIKKT